MLHLYRAQIVKSNITFIIISDWMNLIKMAEGEGFEPSIRCRIHDFQSCAFDHSATPPANIDERLLNSSQDDKKFIEDYEKAYKNICIIFFL